MSFDKPYAGIRVIDLSQGVAGPYSAMLLAQYGTDVIKIEPKEGDWSRTLGQVYGGQTAFSVTANMGKRSIAVNLKDPGCQALLDKMIETADVFIEGFRPGVTDRLGYSYERLKQVNPRLIYVSVSGFGQAGPMREHPAMDPLLQAFTGFMSENVGGDGIPVRTPLIIVDMSTALFDHQAIAGALFAMWDRKEGGKIDVSLMEGAAAFQSIRLMDSYLEGPYRAASAPSGTFKTQDGWLQMIVVKNHEFKRLCEAVGWVDFLGDPRFATNTTRREHAGILTEAAQKLFASGTTAHWRTLLSDAGVQNEKVQTYREFVEHPQTKAVETIAMLGQDGTGIQWPVPNVPGLPRMQADKPNTVAPRLGEHTHEILTEIGLDDQAIEGLIEEGTVA